LRLFCFPYAGGTPSVFRDWCHQLSTEVEVVSILLPGRGLRLREPPHREMAPLVRDVSAAIARKLERPFAFFGHSMGALVAFEVAHALRARALPGPSLLFVSGCRAPHLHGTQRTHELPETGLIEAVRRLGGLGKEGGESDLLQRKLPLLRADLAVCERYQVGSHEPLTCPITACGAVDDPIVSAESIEPWGEYTRGSCVRRRFAGDHFYLQGEQRGPLLRCLSRELDYLV